MQVFADRKPKSVIRKSSRDEQCDILIKVGEEMMLFD